MIDKLTFLPSFIFNALKRLNENKVYEIRIRVDKPIRVCYESKFYYLCREGLSDTPSNLSCNQKEISEIILRAAEFSIYAVNNKLCSGYITIIGGIRIGIAGEIVYENSQIKTQKNFTSLVIRIPHEIIGSANKAFTEVLKSKNKNTLIVSPPGYGKTTILRDLTRLISENGFNTLLVDERSELAACFNGKPQLNVGSNTDIITNSQKDYAFSFGIRSLRPDYIITDELVSASDIEAVKRAALSGVNVIASLHARDIKDIISRKEFIDIIENKIFGRIIILSYKNGVGTYESIYDESLNIV